MLGVFTLFPPVCHVSCRVFTPGVSCVRVCPESVRWLLTQGRTREAERLIRKMAQTNGTAISPHLLADYDTGADEQEEEEGGGPPPPPTPSEQRDTEVRRTRQGKGAEPCRRGLWQLMNLYVLCPRLTDTLPSSEHKRLG